MTETLLRHEVEVDTRIAATHEALYVASAKHDRSLSSLAFYLLPREKRASRFGETAYYEQGVLKHATFEEFISRFASGEWGPTDGYNRQYVIPETIGRAATTAAALNEARITYRETCKEYKGWSRFFLVPGGHVHSSMDCSTCNNGQSGPTRFQWLPSLSGLNEADAVADQGAVLCTICFPTAPVEWTNKFDLDALAKLAKRCAGSGQYVQTNRNWVMCNVCKTGASVTKNGRLRAHNKPEAE